MQAPALTPPYCSTWAQRLLERMFGHTHQLLLQQRLHHLMGPRQLDHEDSSSDDSRSEQDIDTDSNDTTSIAEDESSEDNRSILSEAEIDATAVLVDNSEGETNRPPTPWRSSRAKQRIIDELSGPSSDIFLLIGNYAFKDFGSVKPTLVSLQAYIDKLITTTMPTAILLPQMN